VQLRLTDKKRAAILSAAVQEFRAHGYDATSMDKLAAAAGVSKRTLYNHFPSKDDLFAAILQQLWQHASQHIVPGFVPEADLLSQLEDFLFAKASSLTDPAMIDLCKVAIAATIHNPERARDIVERLGKMESGLAEWIAAAQQAQLLKAGDAEAMGSFLVSMLKAQLFWPQVTMGKPALSEAEVRAYVQLCSAMFFSYYRLN